MTAVENTYRSIWRISGPIIIGLVAQNLMVAIDTAFLGRLGEVTLGAAAVGGLFYLCLVMLGAGFSVGTQIVIGRRNGEGNKKHIGPVFDHGFYFLIALSVLLFSIVSYLAPPFLSWFLQSERILAEGLIFLEHRRYGFLFGFLVLGFNAFYIGTTRTNILIASTMLMATLNIFLDYALIFGHFGMPQMGIAGAAWATNIAELVTFAFLVACSWINRSIRAYRLFRFPKPNWQQYRPLMKVAVPVMFQYFFSFSAWFAFFMVIEQIGETALAASNITRSFYMLLMIPVWGLSSATNSLVSNLIGQGKSHEVIPLIKKVLLTGIAINLVVVQFNIFFPEQIAGFFTNEPHLIEATIPLLRIVSVALISFAFGMIIFSGLSGTGKTFVALIIEMIAIAIYIATAFFLAIAMDASTPAVWFVEVLYFALLGTFSFIYLSTGKWKLVRL